MTQDQWMEKAEDLAFQWAHAAYLKGSGKPYSDIEYIRAKLRAHLHQRPLPVREGTDEATTDQLIELAGALEQRRALAIVGAVSTISGDLIESPFRDGFDSACEEITQRLRTEVWDGCLPPVDASPSLPVRQEPTDEAEFEIHCNGDYEASACGPRAEAWREIQHYAAQYQQDGPVVIYEVTRTQVSASPSVQNMGEGETGKDGVDLPDGAKQ